MSLPGCFIRAIKDGESGKKRRVWAKYEDCAGREEEGVA
jgi:hypothetical protein